MTDNDISYKIRGAIFNVYNFLGPGLLESVYEEALVYELKQLGLKVERQKEVPIKYKDTILNTALRLDLIVEDKVIIELKSVSELKDIHFKQTLTYLRLLELNLGILVNFNTHNILNSIHRIVA
jgi:GxxExxY protein